MAIQVTPSKYIWQNGQFLDWNKASIHIITHGLHYGSGVFEGIRFYETSEGQTALFRLPEHMARLYHSAQKIELPLHETQEKFIEIAQELVRKNGVKQGYMRPVAFYGEGFMGLNPRSATSITALALWPWEAYLSEEDVKAHISTVRRLTPEQTDMHVKLTGHYFNSILASQEARKLGYHEAILLDQNGNIAEGPGENIFMVKNGVLVTPGEKFILPGITRDSILTIAQDEGIKTEQRDITPKELMSADEAFFTGTAAEITIITDIDGKKFSKESPIATRLKKLYQDAAQGKNPKYEKWLTRVTHV
jgi:branched-chain amino acid aminotransferase